MEFTLLMGNQVQRRVDPSMNMFNVSLSEEKPKTNYQERLVEYFVVKNFVEPQQIFCSSDFFRFFV